MLLALIAVSLYYASAELASLPNSAVLSLISNGSFFMDELESAAPSNQQQPKTTHEFLADVSVPTDAPRGLRVFLAALFFVATLLVLYQTRFCTLLMGRINVPRAKIERQIEVSKQLRHSVSANAHTPDTPSALPTVIPHHVFFESESREYKLITAATNALLGDGFVCDNFPTFDGKPLKETAAIIVPMWRLPFVGDRQQMGITEAGYVCSEDDSTFVPSALTIRERPVDQACIKRLRTVGVNYTITEGETPVMTSDGMPRIALSAGLLDDGNLDLLKMSLLHEFMHAHEVPGYRPLFNYVHDDLTYLQDYDDLLSKVHLDGRKNLLDLGIWAWAIVGMILTWVNGYNAVHRAG